MFGIVLGKEQAKQQAKKEKTNKKEKEKAQKQNEKETLKANRLPIEGAMQRLPKVGVKFSRLQVPKPLSAISGMNEIQSKSCSSKPPPPSTNSGVSAEHHPSSEAKQEPSMACCKLVSW